MKFKHSIILKLILLITLLFFSFFFFRSLNWLPIFADEAIYIRWAQRIIDDWQRYLFLPMNDGKTPLVIWLVIPFLKTFTDPLLASRLLSLFFFLGQAILIFVIIHQLLKNKIFALISAITFFLTPFYFWHNRMFLLDNGMNFFFLSSLYFNLNLIKDNYFKKRKMVLLSNVLASALFLFLAIFSKLTALSFIPVFFTNIILLKKSLKRNFTKITTLNFATVFIALALFAFMKFIPGFGQLFSRGSDFLINANDLKLNLIWSNSKNKIFYFSEILTDYFSFSFMLIFLILFSGFSFKLKLKKYHIYLLINFFFLITPLILLGKIIYPRYLLTASFWFFWLTLSLIYSFFLHSKQTSFYFFTKILISILILLVAGHNSAFIYSSFTNPEKVKLTPTDRGQYLTDWSAGYGINEAVYFIKKASLNKKILVLTEGTIGTLPDGLMIYFHQNSHNVVIEGIGLISKKISSKWIEKSQNFDQIILIVNKNRLKIDMPDNSLKKEICRQKENECLQIYDLTSQMKQ